MNKGLFVVLFFGIAGTILYVRYWPTATRMLNHAVELHNEGDSETAITELEKVISEYPRHSAAAKAKKLIREIQGQQRLSEVMISGGSWENLRKMLTRISEEFSGTRVATQAQETLYDLYQKEAKTRYERAMSFKERRRYTDSVGLLEEVCREFESAEYGPKACSALADFKIRVRMLMGGADVRRFKPDGRTWDPRISRTELPPDPMVQIRVDNDLVFESRVERNTWRPVWEQTAVLELGLDSEVLIDLWDYDAGSPDHIGSWNGEWMNLSSSYEILDLDDGSQIAVALEQ